MSCRLYVRVCTVAYSRYTPILQNVSSTKHLIHFVERLAEEQETFVTMRCFVAGDILSGGVLYI